MTTPPLSLGLDIGGTSTRALIVDSSGRRLGAGRGPGANLTSHALDDALDAIVRAVREALAGIDDPGLVRHAVVGTAGSGHLTATPAGAELGRTWRDIGLTCGYDVVSDARVAFVAGTPEPDGTLLLCGTGALAARFAQRRRVHTVDGHGWLLGDLGSGFWLGREAARAALLALDRLEPPGPLARAVLEAVVGDAADRLCSADDPGTSLAPADFSGLASILVLNVHGRPPVALAELAPLVSQAADDDPVAAGILAEAADHLVTAVSTVRTNDDGTPLVLAGSLLTSDTPLRRIVVPRLVERWPKADVGVATDGAAGAAWLAASSQLGPDSPESAELHARLFAES